MSPFLQSLIAATLCLLAGAYLAFRAYRSFSKRAGGSCGGGCSACPSGENAAGAKVKTLLPLEMPKENAKL
jgi:attachment p12 family protein